MEENKIIETIDEEGNYVQFKLYNMVEVDGQDYALLLPVDGDESEDMFLMRIKTEGEDYAFETIEDDEEFEKVAQYLDSIEDEE